MNERDLRALLTVLLLTISTLPSGAQQVELVYRERDPSTSGLRTIFETGSRKEGTATLYAVVGRNGMFSVNLASGELMPVKEVSPGYQYSYVNRCLDGSALLYLRGFFEPLLYHIDVSGTVRPIVPKEGILTDSEFGPPGSVLIEILRPDSNRLHLASIDCGQSWFEVPNTMYKVVNTHPMLLRS
ncbi:MAG: hypothetical protein FGM32_02630 [Candidatus Kapabacteria bacterium]|nr:hypothetical protein [Candidatus Kapabacteria bacterium]